MAANVNCGVFMKNLIARSALSMLSLILLSACSAKPSALPPARIPLSLVDPAPLKMQKVQFVIINTNNAAQVFADLESQGLEPVVFALTGADYKALSTNINDIKSYLLLQQKIIILYKEYYEGE